MQDGKINIRSLLPEEISAELKAMGQPAYRARQVFEWLTRGVESYDEMSNLPKQLRAALAERFYLGAPQVERKQVSAEDGTIKYLWGLRDGNAVETVVMRYHYGNSVCISTQVGCRMGCAFCASGLTRKQRDLTSGEMVAQVLYIQQELDAKEERVSHIVVMGTGEPFDNYDNVMNFLATVNHDRGLAIGARHITISTCGIVPRIDAFAQEHTQYNLAISLHAPNDELRSRLMPINRAYPLSELMAALDRYGAENNRRLTLEYILLRGVNDQPVHARQLAALIGRRNAYVNLIPYNAVDEKGFQGVDHAAAMVFYDQLMKLGVRCTIRKEHGSDIDAACGQLRVKHLQKG